MGGGMPGGDPMMGGEPPMGGPEDDMPGGPDEGGEDPENGPGADVKKYSGELSQALNTYNEENPSDEEKINKYAVNMIAAQVADYLSDKDKRSVIKKLQGKGDDDDVSDEMSPDEQPQGEEPMPQMESRIVREITDELLNGRKSVKRDERFITNKDITKRSPFVSKR
jgi:hypothetical protein